MLDDSIFRENFSQDPYRQMQSRANMYGSFNSQSPMKYSGQSTSTSMPQRQSPAQSSSWGSPQGHFSQNQVKENTSKWQELGRKVSVFVVVLTNKAPPLFLQQTTLSNFVFFSKLTNNAWYFLRIICWQMILTKYHTLFFFNLERRCKICRLLQLWLTLSGLSNNVNKSM